MEGLEPTVIGLTALVALTKGELDRHAIRKGGDGPVGVERVPELHFKS